MKTETKRSIGAIIGLSTGIALMWALKLYGLVPGFIFGAGGAVAGGMLGEKWNSPVAKRIPTKPVDQDADHQKPSSHTHEH